MATVQRPDAAREPAQAEPAQPEPAHPEPARPEPVRPDGADLREPRPELRQTLDAAERAAALALDYLRTLDDRPVGPRNGDIEALRRWLGGAPAERPSDPLRILDELASAVEPGLTAMGSARFFGFVIGGSLPAALGADWLTSAWDQNNCLYLATPGAAVAEEVAASWLVELLGFPTGTSVGFTTGATTANFTAIAAARHALLAGVGWDVEEKGLIGAPELEVVVGDEVHVSVLNALRMAGLGRGRARRVAVDDQGRMQPDELRRVLADCRAPTLVCAQAGNVNSGAFDPLERIADEVERHPAAWLHVDGAFGLWVAASPVLRPLIAGWQRADSWATDAHKTLNVPYDSGLVFVRDAAAHRASMSASAAYLPPAPGSERDAMDYVPEMSRRARAFPIYAALRALGREGVAELVERLARMARRFADRLAGRPGVEVLNEVVFNQVLARFGDDERTRAVVRRVQEDGTAWMGGTVWRGRAAMRISVSNWATGEEDVDRSVEAVLRALATVEASAV